MHVRVLRYFQKHQSVVFSHRQRVHEFLRYHIRRYQQGHALNHHKWFRNAEYCSSCQTHVTQLFVFLLLRDTRNSQRISQPRSEIVDPEIRSKKHGKEPTRDTTLVYWRAERASTAAHRQEYIILQVLRQTPTNHIEALSGTIIVRSNQLESKRAWKVLTEVHIHIMICMAVTLERRIPLLQTTKIVMTPQV